MENLLRSKEYWSVIEHGYTKPAAGIVLINAQSKTLEELKLKDLKAKNCFFQSIDKSILKTISHNSTSKQLLDSMKTKYQGNTRVKKAQLQALRREVMVVANDMHNYGEDMQDVKIVEKIQRTLTEKFNYIVCSIEESNDIDCLSKDKLQSSLIVHEQKFRRTSSEDHVLKVATEERRDRGERGRGRGAYRGRGRGRGRQMYNKAIVECYKCHKLGHFQFECPSWDKEANYAEMGEEEEEILLTAYEEENGARREDIWFLDSGCSNHMSGDKSMFCDLDESFKHRVKLSNNSRMEVTARGNVRLKIGSFTHVISEVYYVPELRNNLLSIGQLQERGLTILIQNGRLKIYHPERGLIVTSDITTNRMFVMIASSLPQKTIDSKPSCLYTSSHDEAHL
ncbi:uncharacterized protein LOC109842418 [Asparagus officinalis]|uniref:uncharacterized protein LOC109842418 n=1 Tax=Asparagus officinalis TaxID=4686 RepID=UPI00098E3E81|nr:uncharacterized protein LOC109842418 [Asparagus officinalis]